MNNKRIELILSKSGYTSELEKCEIRFYIEKLEKALNEIRNIVQKCDAWEWESIAPEKILQIIDKVLGDKK